MLHGSQRAAGLLALAILGSLSVTAFCSGASVRSSTHFTVLAPTARLADMVVGQAEQFRSRIGGAWLGRLPPATPTPALVFIEIDPERSFARTLIDPQGGQHMVWLVGSEQAVTEHLLAHEVAHVVLAGRFGDTMPVWANEGIASSYDNPRRKAIRSRLLREFAEIDSWPDLQQLFEHPVRQQWQYAAAVSVTEYLVDRGGREQFVEFVADGQTSGWDAALQSHYNIASTTALQQAWQRAIGTGNQPAGPAVLAVTAPAVSSSRYVR